MAEIPKYLALVNPSKGKNLGTESVGAGFDAVKRLLH